jgi:hypothetical protein
MVIGTKILEWEHGNIDNIPITLYKTDSSILRLEVYPLKAYVGNYDTPLYTEWCNMFDYLTNDQLPNEYKVYLYDYNSYNFYFQYKNNKLFSSRHFLKALNYYKKHNIPFDKDPEIMYTLYKLSI